MLPIFLEGIQEGCRKNKLIWKVEKLKRRIYRIKLLLRNLYTRYSTRKKFVRKINEFEGEKKKKKETERPQNHLTIRNLWDGRLSRYEYVWS